jgi:hypothetical protein
MSKLSASLEIKREIEAAIAAIVQKHGLTPDFQEWDKKIPNTFSTTWIRPANVKSGDPTVTCEIKVGKW